MKINILFAVGALVIITTTTAICQTHVPPIINFQGKIADTNGVPLGNLPGANIDGQIDLVFRIYNSSNGGTEVWGQTNLDVYVERGLFSVLLSNLNYNSVFPTNAEVCRWLDVEVRDQAATNILAPRKEIVSVPYAINADMVDGFHANDLAYTGQSPISITNRIISLNYDTNDFVLIGTFLSVRDQGIDHGGLEGLTDDDHTQYLTTNRHALIDTNMGEEPPTATERGEPTGTEIQQWADDIAVWGHSSKVVNLNADMLDGYHANSFLTSEDDPQVGVNTPNYVPRWDGPAGALVTGAIFDNGNIGIGTASPGEKLDVNGNIRASRYYDRDNTSFYLDPAGVSYLNDMRASIFYDRDDPGYYVNPAGTSRTGRIDADYLYSYNWIYGTIFYDRDDGNYYLNPNGDSRLANTYLNYIRNYGNLHVDGNVGIGTPSPLAKLDVNGNALIRGTVGISGGDYRIQAVSGPFLALDAWSIYGSDTTVLVPPRYGFVVTDYRNWRPNMWSDGDNGNLSIAGKYLNSISDDRLKFNKQNLDYGLAQVMGLQPKRYDRAEWEVDPETEEIVIHPEKTANEIGLVAQDVQRVIPEAVNVPENENYQLWSISYDTIIPVLVKAIQEQQAQIDGAQRAIEELKQEKQALQSETLTDTPLTADFDGDGKTDRALVDSSGNWHFWLSSSGFVKIGPFNFGVTGKPVASDFDGDGKVDPAIVDSDGNWHVWLSGSGYSQSRL